MAIRHDYAYILLERECRQCGQIFTHKRTRKIANGNYVSRSLKQPYGKGTYCETCYQQRKSEKLEQYIQAAENRETYTPPAWLERYQHHGPEWERLYTVERLSLRQIAALHGLHHPMVAAVLRSRGVERRPRDNKLRRQSDV